MGSWLLVCSGVSGHKVVKTFVKAPFAVDDLLRVRLKLCNGVTTHYECTPGGW
jgi:hypothetical protein